MRFGVLGTGMVGKALAERLAELGDEVMVGSRDPRKAQAGLANSAIKIGTFAEAAAFGGMIINATNGARSLEALRLVGEDNLNGKVLLDIANPLDFSGGGAPSLFAVNTDSLAEQIQRAFPKAMVVKSLNMVTAAVMVTPAELGGGDHDMFVCGNDAHAKEAVTQVLRAFGWRNITDLGDLSGARGMEMYLPLWLRMWGALDTGMFNVKIVR